MTSSSTETRAERGTEFIYAIAGIADLTASRVAGAIRRVQGLAARSDLAMLAGDGRADLLSRGELAFRRRSHVPEAHLETLARRAAAQREPGTDA
jgi:hypothetical protein